jgi:hypothetical protein
MPWRPIRLATGTADAPEFCVTIVTVELVGTDGRRVKGSRVALGRTVEEAQRAAQRPRGALETRRTLVHNLNDQTTSSPGSWAETTARAICVGGEGAERRGALILRGRYASAVIDWYAEREETRTAAG